MKLDSLPRQLNDLASQAYQPREQVFADRMKLRNPLVAFLAAEHRGLSTDMKEQIVEERYWGHRYGFEKDYEQDVNAGQKVSLLNRNSTKNKVNWSDICKFGQKFWLRIRYNHFLPSYDRFLRCNFK